MRAAVCSALRIFNRVTGDRRMIIRPNGRQCRDPCAASTCWKCGAPRTDVSLPFCAECSIIQKPTDTNNYFKVFNMKSHYELDVKELTQLYRKMQSFLHPDKFSNKTDIEKSISLEYSALVNKAYQTLSSPLGRALHLLQINGGTLAEEHKSTDPEFLMEIMELNEAVEAAPTPEALVALKDKNNLVLRELSESIGKNFAMADISQAKSLIIKMKYYSSLSTRLNNLLREKGITD